jgi:hypothetical protein
VSRVFVGIVQTIVITIANINPRYAVAVVAGEEIAETCTAFRLAVLRRLVRSITAVVVSVTIPCGGYASVVRAPEAVGWTRSLRTVHRILVTIVPAVVVAVAQPIRFHAYVRLFTLQMVRRTCDVFRTPVVSLV